MMEKECKCPQICNELLRRNSSRVTFSCAFSIRNFRVIAILIHWVERMKEAANLSARFTMKLETNLLSASSLSPLPDDSFCQGTKFSPDSLCVLTSRCNRLLLFNISASKTQCWSPALECHGGDSVRSYAWYPQMRSNDPSSCCFVGASRYGN